MEILKSIKKKIIATELIAGVTTFLTMAYIIFVNPDILSVTGMDKHSLIIVTCIVTGIITIITGIFTNSPIAMAPGMGLNAYFAYSLVLNEKIGWETALGIVFISGFIFFILTLTGLRKKISETIPKDLLNSIAVGIGVFIAFMGLQNMGIVVKNDATMVSAGSITGEVLLSLSGLIIMIILDIKKIKGSLLIGIVFTTFIAVVIGKVKLPETYFSFNVDISLLFGKLDILSALKIGFLGPIFTLMFMDLFDSIGSILGLASEADMINSKGEVPKLNMLLGIDAIATMIGSVFGTSTTTTYVESAAGIESGGRTGLTSVFTGFIFLISVLFVPLISIVPKYATAPALLIVGYYMIRNISKVNFKTLETGFPSFVIIILISFSYSISKGLAFGFLIYSIVKIIKGKTGELKPLLWIIDVLSVMFLVL